MMENNHIQQIKAEYKKIDDKWLNLHKKVVIGFAAAAFVTECIMFFILHSLNIITSTVPVYIFKYLLVPSVLNAVFVSIIFMAFHSQPQNNTLNRYVASLCFTAICFVLFSVHNIFSSLYLLFALPIILTVIYGDYKLTSITTACCLISKIVGEFLVQWDDDKVSILNNELAIISFIISIAILIALYIICLVAIYFEKQKNEASILKEIERVDLQQKLLKDPLTSLYNRTALRDALADMEKATDNHIFAMVDIDNFKLVNDTYGHTAGDRYLNAIAEIFKKYSEQCKAFRFGGDEFCILFKSCSIEAVRQICEKMQEEIHMLNSKYPKTKGVTASFGIAMYDSNIKIDQLIKNADTALYQSKKNKNSITIYEYIAPSK